MRWKRLPAGALHVDAIPDCAGCYAIYANGRLIYVGMSQSLRARLRDHIGQYAMREKATKVLIDERMVLVSSWLVKYRPERFYGERATLELRLLRRLNPPRNRIGKQRSAA